MHLALIGYGNIARQLLAVLAREEALPARLTVLALPEFVAGVRQALAEDLPAASVADTEIVTDSAALIAARPDLVVECAGHAAVQAHATAVLRAGLDVLIVSIGALADPALQQAVQAAARAGGARAILPAGAVGGVDILAALRASGISAVRYTSRKPPLAWTGTPAETLLDLPGLREATEFFAGNARQAALEYPKNANVAATLALAGLGFEATEVRMIADPAVSRNVHEFSVTAGAADFTIRIEGHPSPDNPKTSQTTVYSVAREILNRMREVAI